MSGAHCLTPSKATAQMQRGQKLHDFNWVDSARPIVTMVKGSDRAVSREKFSSFVTGLLEGYPNPEGDRSGPSRGICSLGKQSKKSSARFQSRGGLDSRPQTRGCETSLISNQEVWNVIGGGGFERVALNPQPPPPR